MSDDFNAVPVEATAIPEKKPGLLSTPAGKIVAIVVGLGLLGIIAGVAVAIVLYAGGRAVVDELEGELVEQTTTTTGTVDSTTTTVAVEAAGPAEEIPNSEIFTFRDIFVPLLKPLPVAGATGTDGLGTTTTTTTADTVTPTSTGVLYLDGVVTENGVLRAQLRFNGTAYTLGPGGTIPGTPWQVLRVSSTSVTMLYGDTQVTLAVGQGITK